VRRALFKIHLWTGMIAGLYILVISVTGSAVVFRREFTRWMLTGHSRGDPFPWAMSVFEWLVDLHDNLLGGHTGRTVNAIGGIAVMVLAITGVVIWWRGAANWARGLMVRRGTGWRRFTFDLHSALGIWIMAFIVLWAISGVYFGFPGLFLAVIEFFEPENFEQPILRRGDWLIEWMVRLHFGRFGGLTSRIIWTVVGLVPAALFVTGTMMWWQRVVRPHRARRRAPALAPAVLADNRSQLQTES
jgi:uncharacterized iron-regulated membrane protein